MRQTSISVHSFSGDETKSSRLVGAELSLTFRCGSWAYAAKRLRTNVVFPAMAANGLEVLKFGRFFFILCRKNVFLIYVSCHVGMYFSNVENILAMFSCSLLPIKVWRPAGPLLHIISS